MSQSHGGDVPECREGRGGIDGGTQSEALGDVR